MALDPTRDRGLVSIEADHLFPLHTTWIGFARDRLLRGYMYDLIALVAPHLERDRVDRAARCSVQSEVESLFADVTLPRRAGESRGQEGRREVAYQPAQSKVSCPTIYRL